jgi:hypothetical protein
MKFKFTKPADLVTFLETNPKLMLIDADGDRYYVEGDRVMYHGLGYYPLNTAHEFMINGGENKFKVQLKSGHNDLTVRFDKFKTFVRFLSDNKNKALQYTYAHAQHSAIFDRTLGYVVVLTNLDHTKTPLSRELFEQLFKDCNLTVEKIGCKR